jgi:hypothetical protein
MQSIEVLVCDQTLLRVVGVGGEVGLETVATGDEFRGDGCSISGDGSGQQNAGVIARVDESRPRVWGQRTPHKLRTNSFLALAISLRATLAQHVGAPGRGCEAVSIRRTSPLKTLGSCSISLRKCVRSCSTNFRTIFEKSVAIFERFETVTKFSP